MQLKIEKGTFTNHSLEDIASALKKGLSENFKNVEVEVVDCPNLREWDCPSEGISGNQKIIDVGGEPYMHCLLYTSPSPRDAHESRMPSSA